MKPFGEVAERLDTHWCLAYQYTRQVLLDGSSFIESPIFDRLAADRFASDKPFNLGDYR